MAYDSGYLDPTSSGSKGTRILATYDHPADTQAQIAAAGYFNAAYDEMKRIGYMRVFADDDMREFLVTSDWESRTITLTPIPKIYRGEDEPTGALEGDLWFPPS